MPNLQAFWVHGTSVQPQSDEDSFIFKGRFGWGTTFRSEGHEWFHFAIPTPVIMDGQRASLKKVFVLFEAEDPWGYPALTELDAVHVWDGSNRIATFDNLSIHGQHFQALDGNNSWDIIPSPSILWGVGISVHVSFPANGQGWVQFMSVGADFETP